jgi:ribonuclease VapC
VIALDSSALVCVAAGQARADEVAHHLLSGPLVISAATFAETRIVGIRKALSGSIQVLLDELDLEIIPVDEAFAERAADAYRRWGKSFHPANLNYGDSFSCALAEMYDCPLLFIGDDFAQTDIRGVLG